jgi:hypothetical protein
MPRAMPKHRLRIHRRGRDAYVGRPPLPAYEAWLEANRSRFRPGQVVEVEIIHDAHCRYPKGKPCTCVAGPEIRVKGEQPGSN